MLGGSSNAPVATASAVIASAAPPVDGPARSENRQVRELGSLVGTTADAATTHRSGPIRRRIRNRVTDITGAAVRAAATDSAANARQRCVATSRSMIVRSSPCCRRTPARTTAVCPAPVGCTPGGTQGSSKPPSASRDDREGHVPTVTTQPGRGSTQPHRCAHCRPASNQASAAPGATSRNCTGSAQDRAPGSWPSRTATAIRHGDEQLGVLPGAQPQFELVSGGGGACIMRSMRPSPQCRDRGS